MVKKDYLYKMKKMGKPNIIKLKLKNNTDKLGK